MIRSGTIHTIREMQMQGKSLREIARVLGIARNTVRRYLRGKPEAVPRPKRTCNSLLQCQKRLPRRRRLGKEKDLCWLLQDSRISGTQPQGLMQLTRPPNALAPPEPPGPRVDLYRWLKRERLI
ncbi:MAG: helix-turn-helix domain-containing protein [Thermogemmatispora sp.]|nr:helix-turn-helix domain-containing protein [Thermogemmatispora sp.]